ncbi:2TM domain-containing protein [Spirosoma fluminis]
MESKHDPILWKQAKARVGFRMHLRSYLLFNAGFWLIWAVINFSIHNSANHGFLFPWPIFPTIGWGIGLLSHYFAVYHRGNERSMIEQEYQKLVNRQSTF